MSEESSEDRITGQCKWFNTEKGFGFIKLPGGGLDVFVHANQLRRSGIETALIEGEKVTFKVDKGPKGAFATDIKRVK